MKKTVSAVSFSLAAALGGAEDVKLPLPAAPVRVVIPDAAAFDAALSGAYRNALSGQLAPGDPLVGAWRQTQVGSKLEDQWSKLSADLPWTWEEIKKLRPQAVAFALLEVGHLEAVLVIETPLATLPVTLPAGTDATHNGVTYQLVTQGAADESEDPERRMGFAWARLGGRLFLSTSERGLKLALDAAQADLGLADPLPGLISLDLDLDALRKDRYFRREFLFGDGPETGHVRAALRLENGSIVEVREGSGEPRGTVFTFEAPGAAASGWEPEGSGFWAAFRTGLLEAVARPADKPVPTVVPLPPAARAAVEDRYAMNFTRPLVAPGAPPWEEGDLALWRALLEKQPVATWGFWLGSDGVRRVVFPWPAARDQEILDLIRTTVVRRAGPTTVVRAGEAQEIQVGPGLPVIAVRRTGAFLWVAPTAAALAAAPLPVPSSDVIRWAKVDLGAVRAEAARWEKAEGPPRPEQIRPLSDRILGVLGWMPKTATLAIERRKTASGWTERLVFGAGGE